MQEPIDNPQKYFESQLEIYTNLFSKVKARIRTISLLRFLTFIFTLIGIYILIANGYELYSLIFILGIALFVYLVREHLKLEKKKSLYEAYIDINLKEIDRIEGKTADHDTGGDYIIPDHSYAEDLDVFGKNSVFQLLNRSATVSGKDRLANSLNNGIFDISVLNERQLAISELSKMPEWRQKFQAIGLLFNEAHDDQKGLISWSNKQTHSFNNLFYKIMLIVNPLLGLSVIALIQAGILTYGTFFIFLLMPMSLVGTRLALLNKIHADVSKKSGLLIKYSNLFGHILRQDFNSLLLQNEASKLRGKNNAQLSISKLAKITKSMDYRLNMLVGFFLNIFFLWDIRQSIRIENWKKKYSKDLGSWFETLSKFDELQSLAGFTFVETESVFPTFKEDNFTLVGDNVKHPFIRKEVSIGNPVKFNNWKEYHVITGANMAGKSTYLRTIGVNILLAMTGTAVLADSFVLSPVKVYTGIKTTDSLQEGESYFYAELLRLKNIIDRLESGERLFIILDEVLRGTNSADKQTGSMALISQFIRLGASGMIATHDLELGKLVNEFPDNITNYRFEVEIENNELEFDYKLKMGVSENLNATFLMKKMGITL